MNKTVPIHLFKKRDKILEPKQTNKDYKGSKRIKIYAKRKLSKEETKFYKQNKVTKQILLLIKEKRCRSKRIE